MRVFKDVSRDNPSIVASLGSYHPYWNDKATHSTNPCFDEFSRMILELKQSTLAAVTFFCKMLQAELEDNIVIAVVPSHKPGPPSGGLVLLAKRLCVDSQRQYIHGLLVRTKEIPRLSSGGCRSLDMHYDSIEVVDVKRAVKSPVLLLDDVVTTGHSLHACWWLLKDNGCPYVQRCALGRTRR